MYLIRLDDACEYMDVEKWAQIEKILDYHAIRPIVGIIPLCEDATFTAQYAYHDEFWDKARDWARKGWTIALHGCNHVYHTKSGGINPVNPKSEFAGLPLETQKEKISKGYRALLQQEIIPTVFFAPAHTFDENTLIAIKAETDIRIISDTIANDLYFKDDLFFLPQQSGKLRPLKFRITTFCLHPNSLSDAGFGELDKFILKNKEEFGCLDDVKLVERPVSIYDCILKNLYFLKRKALRQ